jgi:hypothetical protein
MRRAGPCPHLRRIAEVTPTEVQLDAFVSAIERAFDQAAAVSPGPVVRHLNLGGHAIRLRCAGAALADHVLPAFAHAFRQAQLSEAPLPDLTIDCWDRSATGVFPPSPPWDDDAYCHSGAIQGLAQGRLRITYDRWMRLLTVYDRQQGRVFVQAASASDLPAWLRRSPLRTVIGWWAAAHGMALLHAGAVASANGAVVLAGASGSGKSTTTMTALAAGLGFLADDACLVRFDPSPTAYPVFGLAKLEPDAFARLPAVQHMAIEIESGQTVLNPAAGLLPSAPLRAVALLEISGQERTVVEHVSSRQALHSLVEGSLQEGGGITLAGLRRLVSEMPCHRLRLGTDPDGVLAAVQALSQGVAP